jgi:DNA-binding response OmpR family regulator
VLRDSGYRVIEAATGREELSVLDTVQVDLIVVGLPGGLDGIAVTEEPEPVSPG